MEGLANIPSWIWAWGITAVLGALGGAKLRKKILLFLDAVDEFIDIPMTLLKAFNDDEKISPNEWKTIQAEYQEFKDKLDKLRK